MKSALYKLCTTVRQALNLSVLSGLPSWDHEFGGHGLEFRVELLGSDGCFGLAVLRKHLEAGGWQ